MRISASFRSNMHAKSLGLSMASSRSCRWLVLSIKSLLSYWQKPLPRRIGSTHLLSQGNHCTEKFNTLQWLNVY